MKDSKNIEDVWHNLTNLNGDLHNFEQTVLEFNNKAHKILHYVRQLKSNAAGNNSANAHIEDFIYNGHPRTWIPNEILEIFGNNMMNLFQSSEIYLTVNGICAANLGSGRLEIDRPELAETMDIVHDGEDTQLVRICKRNETQISVGLKVIAFGGKNGTDVIDTELARTAINRINQHYLLASYTNTADMSDKKYNMSGLDINNSKMINFKVIFVNDNNDTVMDTTLKIACYNTI